MKTYAEFRSWVFSILKISFKWVGVLPGPDYAEWQEHIITEGYQNEFSPVEVARFLANDLERHKSLRPWAHEPKKPGRAFVVVCRGRRYYTGQSKHGHFLTNDEFVKAKMFDDPTQAIAVEKMIESRGRFAWVQPVTTGAA